MGYHSKKGPRGWRNDIFIFPGGIVDKKNPGGILYIFRGEFLNFSGGDGLKKEFLHPFSGGDFEKVSSSTPPNHFFCWDSPMIANHIILHTPRIMYILGVQI